MSRSLSPSRKTRWTSAAALAALVAGGGLGVGLLPASPVRAELLALDRPVQAAPSFADVVEKVKPAVVSVRVKVQNVAARSEGGPPGFNMPDVPEDHPLHDFLERFRERRGEGERRGDRGPQGPARQAQGSGFFISGDGYLVTNNHVVENAAEVQVVMDDGRTLEAKVVGTDPKTDLALVKVEGGTDFPHVRLAAAKPRIGDWVVAIGNPFGLGGSVTAGIVSAQARDIGAGPYDDFLQIDAPINRGNSGGPTFNLSGEVVGVNTAIFSPSGGSVGIAFAIPASTVSKVVAELKDHGSVTRGYLGVQIQPVTKEIAEAIGLDQPRGALVAEAQKDSPAAKAGIRSGDAIVALDGQSVKDAKDLTRRVAAVQPGKTVSVTVLRRGQESKIDVTVGKLPGA